MKLKPNSFNESQQASSHADMIQNQTNSVTISNCSTLTSQTPLSKTSTKNKNTPLLLMPLDSSINQIKQMTYNINKNNSSSGVSSSQFKKIQSSDQILLETTSTESSNGVIHHTNAATSVAKETSDSSDSDDSDYVHVTFDLNEHSAMYTFKKFKILAMCLQSILIIQ